jgi:hypothetical protein
LTAAAALLAGPAGAQSLKLGALQFPPTDVVGPWVSYAVRTQSGTRPVREYTQRVAIVATEELEHGIGFWVELKTTGLGAEARIERGLFVESPSPAGEPPTTRLRRYQVLTPGGKVYEYPVDAASEIRVGAQVSTFELFEYDPDVAPVLASVGPDTLRIGRRVVPTLVDRSVRVGTDDWTEPGDSAVANRTILIQTYWRNAAIPITGFARSLFQVASIRYPHAAADSGAAPDSLSSARADSARGGVSPDSLLLAAAGAPTDVISWTELTLLDLGSDAVPEVTQQPEPDPAEEAAPAPGTER